MKEIEELTFYNSDNPKGADSAVTRIDVSINYNPLPHDPMLVLRKATSMSKRRILKNFYALGTALFVCFSGFAALANLQSTLNSAEGVGTESQATIYAVSRISALLLPELFIKTIGCKKTLLLAIIGNIPYLAANFYPSVYTLIPTALLVGLLAGPLTASQSVYTNEMARRYHSQSNMESYEVVVARFFGILYFFCANTQIWGNLISYYVLRPSWAPILNNTHENHCGAHFSPSNEKNNTNTNFNPPIDEKRFLLVGIYVLCSVLSFPLMLFFMDPLENDVERKCSTKSHCQLVISRLAATAKHSMDPNQMLLVPISIFVGIQMSFYSSEFTRAFIACSWGVYHVGFVSICFGACGVLMSFFLGPLVKCTSQMSVILLAFVLNLVMYILLFFWKPSPEVPAAFFVFAGVYGITDAVWWSQVAALYGLMFPNNKEAAFSNFFFWRFLGLSLSYGYSKYLPVVVKICIMLLFLVVGTVLYIVGQIKIKYFSHRTGYTTIEVPD